MFCITVDNDNNLVFGATSLSLRGEKCVNLIIWFEHVPQLLFFSVEFQYWY